MAWYTYPNGGNMPKPKGFKSIHLTIPPDFHRKLKVAVALKDTTISKYVMDLVEADLNKMAKRPIAFDTVKEASGG